MDFDPERFVRSPFVIGFIGAAIGAYKFMPGTTLLTKIGNAASGSAFAGYLAPPLVAWLKMPEAVYGSGAAFVFGLVGMSLSAAILNATLKALAETQFGVIVTGWLSRRG